MLKKWDDLDVGDELRATDWAGEVHKAVVREVLSRNSHAVQYELRVFCPNQDDMRVHDHYANVPVGRFANPCFKDIEIVTEEPC
jgi:hypothetical protein